MSVYWGLSRVIRFILREEALTKLQETKFNIGINEDTKCEIKYLVCFYSLHVNGAHDKAKLWSKSNADGHTALSGSAFWLYIFFLLYMYICY